MVKKNKSRQMQESPTIPNGGDSAESGDQKKICVSGFKCSHIQKAIHLTSIKRALKNGCLAGDCPGCIRDGVKSDGGENTQSSGLWLCLQCGHQGCGRTENQHALKHFNVVHSDPHCVAVNTTSWNVWCYSCAVEIPSEYRKKIHECVKYLKNLDCPSSTRVTGKSIAVEGNRDAEGAECSPMPLADVTNMPHGLRAPKRKMICLPRVRGLQNLGNTCFFNSVMQCLAQTPHFLELLQDTQQEGMRFCLPGGKGLLPKEEHEEEEEEEEELPPLEGTLTKWGTLTETLANTLEELRQDDATAVNPQRLFNKLTNKCPQFGGGDQHDAHELLRHLLDEVRTEDLKRYRIAILDQYGLSRRDTNETVDSSVRTRVRAYGRQAGELLLLPDPVFRGILVSTVECQDCLHSYQRTEPFYELSLPVTTNKPQPPVMRRKTGGEDSFDVCGNMTNDTPSKHQLKKERRQQRKGRKKNQPQQQQKGARSADLSAEEPAIAEEAHNTAESEQSDADVEDNVEQDVALNGVRTGQVIVNGDVIPSVDVKLCNGNVSENEHVEDPRTLEEECNGNRTVCSSDLVCSVNEKLCNGARDEKKAVKENRVVTNSVGKQSGSSEDETSENKRMFVTRGEDDGKRVESTQGKTASEGLKMKEDTELQNSVHTNGDERKQNNSEENRAGNNIAVSGNTLTPERKIVENGIAENPVVGEIGNFGDEADENKTIVENGICERTSVGNTLTLERKIVENGIAENPVVGEMGNFGGEAEGNKTIVENGICERTSVGNENIEILDASVDSSFSHTKDLCKEVPSEELSLAICPTVSSPAVNSPSTRDSFMSNTGSPSSVSSDLNVDLNLSNQMSTNSWLVEDTDRPFSRIAFCNDDDSATSNNDRQKTALSAENSLSKVQKTPGGEGCCKEAATGDQLAKELSGLTLGHDECQSPSHWDTCSAHSLEDSKESKTPLPLEAPLCNGGSKSSEPEPVDDGDKSGTLAPRYQCGDKECSIESCLNHFTLLELMTGSCKVICESCTERINKGKEGKMVATNSTKQYLVSNPPAVLVLHLKRFEVHQNMFRKTPRHVTFPMMLDIAPICNTKCRELPTIRKGQTKVLYSLYGVVQHSGTLHGGHYSAYVKVRAPVRRDDVRWCFLPTAESSERLEELSKGSSVPSEAVPGKWYHVSDSRVNEVNEDRVLHSQAYLLFYERVW